MIALADPAGNVEHTGTFAARPRGAGVAAPATGGTIVRALGRSDYLTCWRSMQSFTAARSANTPDEIWLTEHPPVYTFGLAGRREHLLRDNGIPVLKVDRGGQVTYHGPGQLVAYLLVDLRRARLGVRDMVRRIEGAVIAWLAERGVTGYGKPSAPGIYVRRSGVESKIGSLGLKLRNGCSYHGVAVNIAMDLAPFADIDPCGYPGLAVTQLADFGIVCGVAEAGATLAPHLAARIFAVPAVAIAAAAPAGDAPAAGDALRESIS